MNSSGSQNRQNASGCRSFAMAIAASDVSGASRPGNGTTWTKSRHSGDRINSADPSVEPYSITNAATAPIWRTCRRNGSSTVMVFHDDVATTRFTTPQLWAAAENVTSSGEEIAPKEFT